MLRDKFSKAKGVVLTDYKGLTVAELSGMRRRLRDARVEYRVVRNTLARLAAAETPVSPADGYFVGPVGIAIGYDDPVNVVRSVLDYARENNKLGISCGVIEGRLVDSNALKDVAKLPPRDVLLAMLGGALSSPTSKMASLLRATIQMFGYVLNALKDKKGN